MTSAQSKTHSISNILGIGLLVFGALLSYVRLESATQQLSGMLQGYGAEAFGLLPAVGLASARLLQDWTLDPTSTLPMFARFLLSCWPVVVILFGVALLRKTLLATLTTRSLAGGRSDSRSPRLPQ